jgi:hypothetical protein
MQKLKRFFFASLGVLALSLAFHFGAQTAQGQAGDDVVIRTEESRGENRLWVVTQKGNIYLVRPAFVEGAQKIEIIAKGSIHDPILKPKSD